MRTAKTEKGHYFTVLTLCYEVNCSENKQKEHKIIQKLQVSHTSMTSALPVRKQE